MGVYGYTRASTDRQANEGESPGAQQGMVEGRAMIFGLKVDRIFVERSVSGSKPLDTRLLAALKGVISSSPPSLMPAKLQRLAGRMEGSAGGQRLDRPA